MLKILKTQIIYSYSSNLTILLQNNISVSLFLHVSFTFNIQHSSLINIHLLIYLQLIIVYVLRVKSYVRELRLSSIWSEKICPLSRATDSS